MVRGGRPERLWNGQSDPLEDLEAAMNMIETAEAESARVQSLIMGIVTLSGKSSAEVIRLVQDLVAKSGVSFEQAAHAVANAVSAVAVKAMTCEGECKANRAGGPLWSEFRGGRVIVHECAR